MRITTVVTLLMGLITSCSGDNAGQTNCTDSSNIECISSISDSPNLNGTFWRIVSVERSDGIVEVVPPEANWRVRFNPANSDEGDTLELRFNCNSYKVEYTLIDNVFTTKDTSGFGAPSCINAGLELHSLESFVDFTLTGNVFEFSELDNADISLKTGNNVVFLMTPRSPWQANIKRDGQQ